MKAATRKVRSAKGFTVARGDETQNTAEKTCDTFLAIFFLRDDRKPL